MKTDTAKKIIDYIKSQKQTTAKELANFLNISPQALFRQLKKLLTKGLISKIGTPPRVFYFIPEQKPITPCYTFKLEEHKIIEENFLFVSTLGQIQTGIDGFVAWCQSRKQDPVKTAPEYARTFKKYDQYKKNGLINGMIKAKSTFETVALNHLFYLDFYSIERFGKTKLGQHLLYAKLSQNKTFIKTLTSSIKPKVEKIIEKHQIDGVCFVPPTVKREVQLMKELEDELDLSLKSISIQKVNLQIPIPQKTLSKLEDRIENARRTIVVDEKGRYNNILIIDDAVGSGATINETARQIKEKSIAKKIVGLAITGSFKGFDVISEV